MRQSARAPRPIALKATLVWIWVCPQLLEKAPQPAGLDWQPRLVSRPRLEKAVLNRELLPGPVSPPRPKTAQPAHSESPLVA
jgi:hypothetical protein